MFRSRADCPKHGHVVDVSDYPPNRHCLDIDASDENEFLLPLDGGCSLASRDWELLAKRLLRLGFERIVTPLNQR